MTDLTEIVARALANRDPGRNYDTMTDWSQSYWREIADVALSALREAGALVEWRDIESAPKDGTNVLLAYHQDQFVAEGFFESECPGEGFWCRANEHWTDAHDAMLPYVTHWSPLPAPPLKDGVSGDA